MVRKVIFYGATSIDGYLSDKNHSLDWLFKYDSTQIMTKCYQPFIEDVDTTIMGRTTYDDLLAMTGEVPYQKMNNYIFSHREISTQKNVFQVDEPVSNFVTDLKQQDGKNIWIIGGGKIVTELVENKLIDQLQIQIAPVILGNGARLFENMNVPSEFSLTDADKYGQFTNMVFNFQK